MIFYHYETIISLPYEEKITKGLLSIIAHFSKTCGDLNYIFCDDDYLLKINEEYLNHIDYTDVITFDYVSGNTISGDIFISITRVEENAKTYGVPFLEELLRVIAHGLLHLLGFNDKTQEEANKMRIEENKAIMFFVDVPRETSYL